MREVEERAVWAKLAAACRGRGERSVSTSRGVDVDLSRGCTVIAGRNGAGKSQVLAAAKDALHDQVILVQLHRLCEHALATVASRGDIEDMEAETGEMVLDHGVLEHVQRVIGREYEDVKWFALELEPSDELQESFRWPGEQVLVPHFRLQYKGVEYSTLELGLGELSMHVLFWVFQQYRDVRNVTLLLDEPDAYLPPIGSARLLARIQDVCLRRGWDLVVTTHSEEMIRAASENDGLMVLRRGEGAVIEARRTWVEGPEIAAELLPTPVLDLVTFCEDESAAALIRAILRAQDAARARSTAVIWKDGHGYLTALSQHLPRYRGMKIHFGLVYDGDQRSSDDDSKGDIGWPKIFLPGTVAPDDLFKTLAGEASRLAERLQVSENDLRSWCDALEGADPHDWVNGLCDRHGVRTTVLDALAELWVELHAGESAQFMKDLSEGLLDN